MLIVVLVVVLDVHALAHFGPPGTMKYISCNINININNAARSISRIRISISMNGEYIVL